MSREQLIEIAVSFLQKANLDSIKIEENRPTLSYNNGDGYVHVNPVNYYTFTISGIVDIKKEGDLVGG